MIHFLQYCVRKWHHLEYNIGNCQPSKNEQKKQGWELHWKHLNEQIIQVKIDENDHTEVKRKHNDEKGWISIT